MKRYLRFRHFIKAIYYWLMDSAVIKTHKDTIPNTILIVRVEAIGDYLLFRNFLSVIKKNKKYKDYKITLCGNILYKDIAEHFDKNEVDYFIWVDRKLFVSERAYRKQILKTINDKKFDTVIQPNYSREFLIGDSIIRASNAKNRIGCNGDTANDIFIFKAIANNWYTQLINVSEAIIWEFDRNKNFFEQLLLQGIDIFLPSIKNDANTKENYIVFFPGAGEKIKQWSKENFLQLAKYIGQKHYTKIVICGAMQDDEIGKYICSNTANNNIENLCGKTLLVELINIIAKAKFLVTNDSSAFHIGACVNTQTICLLNGRHYGRFAPYPSNANANLHYIYPHSIKTLLSNMQEAVKQTKHKPPALIDEITIEQVIIEVENIYQNTK